MRTLKLSSCLIASIPLFVACSGVATTDITGDVDSGTAKGHDGGSSAPDGGGGAHTGDSGDKGGETGAPSPESGDAASGPRVYVRINAVTTPINGVGAAAETPTDQRVGIYGLTLLKTKDDPAPLVVIDMTTALDVPYNDNASTLLGSAAASALPAGTYTVARVPVGYVNFTVAGTVHTMEGAFPGDFHDIIALTTGVELEGASRARGWYETSFLLNGMTYGSTTGTDSQIAQPAGTSGIGLDLSGAVAFYTFPINLVIPSDITKDLEVVFTANTYEDFHWTDENMPGYKTGVFDVSETSYETVTQLGANSCTVTVGPAPTPP